MKIISLILIIIFPLVVFSQTETTGASNKFAFGINTGLNSSKLHSDTADFRYGYMPFVGLYGSYEVKDRFYFKTSVLYSIKSSTATNPYLKFNNEYIDFNITGQYEIFDNIKVQTGVSYSSILSSNSVVNRADGQGTEWVSINGYDSEFNLLAGFEFQLQDNVMLEFNYAIPLKANNTHNFQLGINFLLLNRTKDENNYKKIRNKISKEQINTLKENVLMVRLKTSVNSIEALKKMGENEAAEKLKEKQRLDNLAIVNAFNDNFNFCEVMFFYSNNTANIEEKKFDNVFLNDSLQVDSSIKVSKDIDFFIAEFENLEQDTMKYFSHYEYIQSIDGGLEPQAVYNGTSSDFNFYALRIIDNNLVQLNRPFPFYVKVRQPIIFRSAYGRAVSQMNSELIQYYKRNSNN